MYKIVSVAVLLFLSSCISYENLRLGLVDAAKNNGFEAREIQTSLFKIFTIAKITNPKKPIRVYIEGDGNSWVSRSQLSTNPTPLKPMLANLAFHDTADNILYIARPCQYVDDAKCEKKYWSSGVYAAEIIDSIAEVIDGYAGHEIEYIGYSGGATIAMFLAAATPNTKSLTTIAGNLDTQAFVALHDVSPLSDSRDTDEVVNKLADIPQHHLIGADDEVITKLIYDSYASKLQHLNCTKFSIIKNASHVNGWNIDVLPYKVSCYND